jgi:DNA repair protein RadC
MLNSVKPGRKLVERGAESCSDAEILAILIGTGGPAYSALDCAGELLDKYGTVTDLMDRPIADLTSVRGIKATKAVRIAAAYELARRLIQEVHNQS